MRRRISVLIAVGFALLLVLGVLTSLAMIGGLRETMTRAQASQSAALEVRASVRSLRADYLAASDTVTRLLFEPTWLGHAEAAHKAEAAAATHLAAAARATGRPELKAVLGTLRRHDHHVTKRVESVLVDLAGTQAAFARDVYVHEYLPARAQNLAYVDRALALAVDEVAHAAQNTQDTARQTITFAWLALALFMLVGTTAGLRLSGVVREIVRDFEEAAGEVREQRDRLQAAMTAMRDALLVVDARGIVTLVNDAACMLLGFQRDELVGRPLAQWLDPGMEPAPLQPTDLANHPTAFVARDGSRIPMSVSAAPLRSSDGTVVAAVWVARDMRDHLRMLAEVEAARDAALEGSRTKSEFLANMSHEIRTPMHVIIGYTDMIRESVLDEEQTRCLDGVRRSSIALLEIINDILDLSKVEAGKLTFEDVTFPVRPTVADAVESLAIQARDKGLGLRVDVSRDTPQWLRGDPTRLRQVLVNLVGNAVKFTDDGEVAVRVAPASPSVDGARMLHVSVRDTGIGIPADKLDLVFGAFTQADGSMTRRYGGTGLGLTIAARLVEMMGGKIWVESEPGRGSTFHFTVPLELASAAAAGRADVAAARA